MKTNSIKFTTLASLIVGTLPLSAQANAVVYDGTDTSLLADAPFWSTPGSLFPDDNRVNNQLNIVGGNIDGLVSGGISHGADIVSSNVVSIIQDANFSPVTVGGTLAGGSAINQTGIAAAHTNKLIIHGGTLNNHTYGGYAYSYTYTSGPAAANGNKVEIAADAVIRRTVAGSYAKSEFNSATANNNAVSVCGNATISDRVYGGFADSISGAATATANSVVVSGGVTGRDVYGGFTFSSNGISTATDNVALLSGGTVKRDIAGGFAYSENNTAVASNNVVIISGGIAEANVFGGYADSDAAGGMGQANNNSVVISGGTVAGNIYGGQSFVDGFGETGEAIRNTVTIYAEANTSASVIYGGLVSNGSTVVPGMDARSGNMLNLHGKGIAAVGVGNFEVYNFYLPDNVVASDTLLTLSGSTATDLTDSKVNVHIAGVGTTLGQGDSLILVDATTGGITGTPVQGEGMQGITLRYEIQLDVVSDQLIGTIAGIRATDQSKSLSEGWLAGLALANRGADMVANHGMDAAVSMAGRAKVKSSATDENTADDATSAEADSVKTDKPANNLTSDWRGFYAMGGGSLRYATGSHVSMDTFSLITGISKGVDMSVGRLSVGAFFEYGYGSYNTYNTYGSGNVNADGIAHYYGGGMLLHMAFVPTGPGHFYAEASARGGAIDNSFGSSDFAGSLGSRASYDYTTGYYGMHIGTGYVWKYGETVKNTALNALTIDTSAKFLWTTQDGQDATMSTGDQLKFKAADSLRLRLSSRASYAINDTVSVYGGLGWEYEFNGDADAMTNGFSILAPSLCGGTGVGELGITVKPFTEGNLARLSFGLGVQGYVGKREGVTGSGHVQYSF